MGRFVIFGAADFEPSDYMAMPEDYILAADGGLRHVEAIGRTPNAIIGDFDSLGYTPVGAQVFPIEKDDTDTMLAIKQGLKMGYREFVLLGCLGGDRLDHTIANIQSLLYLVKHDARGYLIGQDKIITAMKDEAISFSRDCHGILSLFCFGSEASGIFIEGLQYPLENSVLSAEFPLGVSNHFQGKEAKISVSEGSLIVIWDKKNGFPKRVQ